MSYRPTLYGNTHAVSAGHYLAAAAAYSILEAGGNAVDAGCAAGLALGVLQPDIVNVAGVAPIILRMADGTVESIAGLGHWPRSIPPDIFMREHGGKMPAGVLRTVVPAAPDAWITALIRHGTMSFGDVARAAIGYAADGFLVHADLAHTAKARAHEFLRWQQNGDLFLPGGKPLEYGQRLKQSDLAKTLRYMVDEEKTAAGKSRIAGLEAARAAFYSGDIAREIVAFQKREGGYLSMEDLSQFHSPIEPVVRRNWRGHEIMTCGPWCQGPALVEALLLIEKIGIDGLAHNSPEYLHVVIEALKIAMADREVFFGDPNFIHVPLDDILSETGLARRAALFSPDRAAAEMPLVADGTPKLPEASRKPLPTKDADTSYACVVDRWGNAFSTTPSDGSYNVPIVPGLGIAPSGRGSQSMPDPSHPRGLYPGKRPRLTPNPALAVLADGGVMPFGTPGGDVQVQAMLQVLLNILHFGFELQDAIEAPRVATYSFPSSFAPYDYHPGKVAMEARIDPATFDALKAKGHLTEWWPEWSRVAGCVEVARTTPATGTVSAGADVRRPAYAIVS